MSRHARGFRRVAKTRQWNAERYAISQQREIVRLRQLIRQAANRATEAGLAYDEFDALIDEVKRWEEQ